MEQWEIRYAILRPKSLARYGIIERYEEGYYPSTFTLGRSPLVNLRGAPMIGDDINFFEYPFYRKDLAYNKVSNFFDALIAQSILGVIMMGVKAALERE